MDYVDFELEVQSGAEGSYDVSVVQSPAGEAHGAMRFPYDTLALESKLKSLQIALLRSAASRRTAGAEDVAVQELGRDLYQALFAGDIASRLHVSRMIAKGAGKGVRIKLRILAPELLGLPWEYLYDADGGNFLALAVSTPVVRYMPIAQPIVPLEVTPPLRILAMTAGPRDLGQLDAQRERERLETALEKLIQKGTVQLEWVAGESWEDLQEALWNGPWHIFHFVGHGGFNERIGAGVIYLTGPDGNSRELSANDLALLLGDHDPLRLAVLNSCETAQGAKTDIFSSTAAALVRKGTPAVVAMQFEITDDAAIQFSRVFYAATAHGMPVDSAVAEARKSLALNVTNSYEWGTPVLFMRSPDGVLFRVPTAAESPEIKAAVKVHQDALAAAEAMAAEAAARSDDVSPAETPVAPRSEPATTAPANGSTPVAAALAALAAAATNPAAAPHPAAAPPPATTPPRAAAPPPAAAPPVVQPTQPQATQAPPPPRPLPTAASGSGTGPPPTAGYGWPAPSSPPWNQPWVGQPQPQENSGRRFPTWVLVGGFTVAVLVGLGILAALLSSPPTAAISIAPPAGPPGSTVTVFGSGFPAFESIEVRWANQPAFQQLQTNAAGAFITTLNVPNRADAGQRQIDARSQGASAVALFSVLNDAEPGPPDTAIVPTDHPTAPPTPSAVTDEAIAEAMCVIQVEIEQADDKFDTIDQAITNGDTTERDRQHAELRDDLIAVQNALVTVRQWPPATVAADEYFVSIDDLLPRLQTWVAEATEESRTAVSDAALIVGDRNEALFTIQAANSELALPCATSSPT